MCDSVSVMLRIMHSPDGTCSVVIEMSSKQLVEQYKSVQGTMKKSVTTYPKPGSHSNRPAGSSSSQFFSVSIFVTNILFILLIA